MAGTYMRRSQHAAQHGLHRTGLPARNLKVRVMPAPPVKPSVRRLLFKVRRAIRSKVKTRENIARHKSMEDYYGRQR